VQPDDAGLPAADEQSRPFGCLTQLGVQQMRSVGRKLRICYGGHCVDSANLEVCKLVSSAAVSISLSQHASKLLMLVTLPAAAANQAGLLHWLQAYTAISSGPA
jgi:hypothetical protein